MPCRPTTHALLAVLGILGDAGFRHDDGLRVCHVVVGPHVAHPSLSANETRIAVPCREATGACALRHWFAFATAVFPAASHYGVLFAASAPPALPLRWHAQCPLANWGRGGVGELRIAENAWSVNAVLARTVSTDHAIPRMDTPPAEIWHAFTNLCRLAA